MTMPYRPYLSPLLLIAAAFTLSGCMPWPMVVPVGPGMASAKASAYVKSIEAKAAQDPSRLDDDLADASVRAIVNGTTGQAIDTYKRISKDESQPAPIRAAAIYQIGLIKMSPFNENQDTEEAYGYLKMAHQEFPNDLQFCRNIFKHMDRLRSGDVLTTRYDDWSRYELRRALAEKIASCPDLKGQSLLNEAIVAIRKDSSRELALKLEDVAAEGANSDAVRAAAYTQLGLIFRSKYNPDKDLEQARHYFDQARALDDAILKCYGVVADDSI